MGKLSSCVLALALTAPAAARGAPQSVLDPHGPNARAIADIAWLVFAGAAVIFVLVMGFVALAVFAKRERRAWLGARASVIGGGIVFPFVVLSALLVYTLVVAARMQPAAAPAVRIEITGHQWWWRVSYLDADGRPDFITANELHLPVGEPIELLLQSADVLHSFWVPALAGKLDMIPGQTNRLRFTADRAALVRGQCAEYCGGPHAQMAIDVSVAPSADFDAWRNAQRAPARAPDSDTLRLGHELFLARCAVCHTVRGTSARGTLGPDLTHVASRRSIGAGVLPANVGAFAGWIVANQQHKPGNLMPAFDASFDGGQLHALAQYMASLR